MTDEVLQAARDRVRRLQHVRRLRAATEHQLTDVERELAQLRRVYLAEAGDVDRLERRTLSSIVTGVLGTKNDRLAKERAEAETARLRLAGHQARHRRLADDLGALQREQAALADAPQWYE